MQPLEVRDHNIYNLFRCGFLTNQFHELLFKFNTGTLNTNAMIANFVVDQDPACSRCTGGCLLPAPKESLACIFFDCPMISNILTELNNLTSNNSLDLEELKNFVWLGVSEKKHLPDFKTSLIVMTTNYFIYKSRKLPGTPTISKYKAFLPDTLPEVFYGIINE